MIGCSLSLITFRFFCEEKKLVDILDDYLEIFDLFSLDIAHGVVWDELIFISCGDCLG